MGIFDIKTKINPTMRMIRMTCKNHANTTKKTIVILGKNELKRLSLIRFPEEQSNKAQQNFGTFSKYMSQFINI